MTPDTIAVVDGDDSLVEQLRDLLEQFGYAIRRLNSSADVVAELQATPPRLVLIELVAANYLHGVELATVLKLSKRTRALPIVMISNDAERLHVYETQLRQRNAPKLWTLARPLDRTQALRAFAEALGQSALLVREAP
jgi:PleD family two-component response regulator